MRRRWKYGLLMVILKGRREETDGERNQLGKRLKVRGRVKCRGNEKEGEWKLTKTERLTFRGAKQKYFNLLCNGVDIKENLEEQQNVAIIVPMLSRVYSGTLNIQLGSFGRYIASP